MTQPLTDFEKAYKRATVKRRMYFWLREHPASKVSTIRKAMGVQNVVVTEILADGVNRDELLKSRGFWNADLYTVREGFDIGSISAEVWSTPTPVQQPIPAAPHEFAAEFAGISKPAVKSVVPPEPDPPADPIDNSKAILARYPSLKSPYGVLLVNAANPLNLAYCSNNGQLAAAVERWDVSFQALPIFRDAKRVWVVLDVKDENDILLRTLLTDEWLREKTVITVGSGLHVLNVAQSKCNHYKGNYCGAYGSDPEAFENCWHFTPLPKPTDEERIQQLPCKPEPLPAPLSAPIERMPVSNVGYDVPEWEPHSGGNGNDGSSAAM